MTLSLEIMCPSTGAHEAAITTWRDTMTRPWEIRIDDTIEGAGAGYLVKAQKFYESSQAYVLGILHSDLFILEHYWDERVLAAFEDEKVAVVSFFGARRLGHDDLYKIPYQLVQMARGDCVSNLVDAEAHGARFRGECDVAMIDSFSLFVRRDFLKRIGGWAVGAYPPSHMSDFWICCMAHRAGMKVRYVGVHCKHSSGGVRGNGTFDYATWAKGTQWGSDEGMHSASHALAYDQFRDVLPVRR